MLVTTNGTLSFLCLMVFCGAMCIGIQNTSVISVVIKFSFVPAIRERVCKFFCFMFKCVILGDYLEKMRLNRSARL